MSNINIAAVHQSAPLFWLSLCFLYSHKKLFILERWMNGCLLTCFHCNPPHPPNPCTPPHLLLLLLIPGPDRESEQQRRCSPFWFCWFLFPDPLVEFWIPLGWCWCEQLSPRWQTLQIKPGPCIRLRPSKDGKLPCPFHSISVSPFFFKQHSASFCLFLSIQLWFSFIPLPPYGVPFHRSKASMSLRKKNTRNAVYSAAALSLNESIFLLSSFPEQRPCAQISVHAKSEPEVFYTTASEVITNGHRREGR